MLRKSLLFAICFCFVTVPMAMADRDPVRQEPTLFWGQQPQVIAQNTPSAGTTQAYDSQKEGVCYKEQNGRGYTIGWADTKSKCRNGGSSWVNIGGEVTNFQRGK